MPLDDLQTRQLLAYPPIAALFERLFNREIEESLLACALHDPRQFARCHGRIAADDFADPIHAAIWQAIGERLGDGRKIDHLLLAELGDRFDAELRHVGGGRAFLAGLVAEPVLASQSVGYADELRELARRRRMALAMVEGLARAEDRDTSLADLLGGVVAEAERLVESGKARTRGAVLDAMIDGFARPAVVYSTGMPSLDFAMGGGLYPGRVYAIAAHDKAGKTALAGTISANLNHAGHRHAYFALEMGAEQIEQRQLARELGIGSTQFLRPNEHVVAAVAKHRHTMPDHVVYVDMPGGTVDELRGEILAAKARHRISGFVLDYWQLVEGRGPKQSDEEHLSRVAQWLANVAKRLNLWVIVLAQLADDGEATARARRGLNRAVDQLYFLHRPQGEDFGWLQMRISRYTPVADIGGKNDPSLKMVFPGPWFEDWRARGNDGPQHGPIE